MLKKKHFFSILKITEITHYNFVLFSVARVLNLFYLNGKIQLKQCEVMAKIISFYEVHVSQKLYFISGKTGFTCDRPQSRWLSVPVEDVSKVHKNITAKSLHIVLFVARMLHVLKTTVPKILGIFLWIYLYGFLRVHMLQLGFEQQLVDFKKNFLIKYDENNR